MVLRNILIDSRFSITREWCGKATPQYVVRFCGEWLSAHATRDAAKTARTDAIHAHRAALGI